MAVEYLKARSPSSPSNNSVSRAAFAHKIFSQLHWFAIGEEYPPRLDTSRAPLDAALFDLLHHGVLLRIRRRWLLDRARRIERREHESAL